MTTSIKVPNEAEMLALGDTLARQLASGGVVYLQGPLGAGKTTLVRGILRALGHVGRVKSPTYSLLESYALPGLDVHHLDLYRLGQAEELAFLGLEDLLTPASLILIEWPDRGQPGLPRPTLTIRIEDDASGGRVLRLTAATDEVQRGAH